jgi:hypothetical protein
MLCMYFFVWHNTHAHLYITCSKLCEHQVMCSKDKVFSHRCVFKQASDYQHLNDTSTLDGKKTDREVYEARQYHIHSCLVQRIPPSAADLYPFPRCLRLGWPSCGCFRTWPLMPLWRMLLPFRPVAHALYIVVQTLEMLCGFSGVQLPFFRTDGCVMQLVPSIRLLKTSPIDLLLYLTKEAPAET